MEIRTAAIVILTGVALSLIGAANSQSINKWVDENGKTHYGSQPPANVASESIKKPAAVTPGAASTPLVKRDELVLYTTSWCGYCRQARKYLNDRGISYVEKDIEKDRFANSEFQRFGPRGVPLLVRNGEDTRRGFSPQSYDHFFAKR